VPTSKLERFAKLLRQQERLPEIEAVPGFPTPAMDASIGTRFFKDVVNLSLEARENIENKLHGFESKQ